MTRPDILVAGIGNVFLGDDRFGVAVAERLAARPLRPGVKVRVFGIRGVDLAYALIENVDLVIMVDAMRRGSAPGTLYVLEPDAAAGPAAAVADMETHGMAPVRAIEMARALGTMPGVLRIVGCEPASFGDPDIGSEELSEPVAKAVDGAVELIESIIEEYLHQACTNLR